MRLGQIRRLDYWLRYTKYLSEKDNPNLSAARNHVAPIIAAIVAQHLELENETELKMPFIDGRTLEQIEIDCYGFGISRLLIGGYAPGNYMGRCYLCENTTMADKRCFICIPCAGTRQINLS